MLEKPTIQISLYDCDPGGNYTYIVCSQELERKDYGYVDSVIRSAYPHFEQGGFIEPPTKEGCVLRLHIAGGEFCGNAIRCLAALIAHDYSGKRGLNAIADYSLIVESPQQLRFAVEISGSSEILSVVCTEENDEYLVKAVMPFIKEFSSIIEKQITLRDQGVRVVIVRMEGITHILIDEAIFPFLQDADQQRLLANSAITQCGLEKEPAVGLIWHSTTNTVFAINPIVWVRDIDTCIFESACGSGTLALSLATLKDSDNAEECYEIQQPSGATIKATVSKSSDKKEFTSASAEGFVSLRSLPGMQISKKEALDIVS